MEKIEISKIIHNFLLSSSAHGLPRLLRSKNCVIKILWSIALVTSTICGSYFVIKNSLDYLKYETVTTISLIEENEVEFPTLSFCSLNNFSSFRL